MGAVKRKILFLVTQSEMGGAQRYVYEVAEVLAERHEILVAAGEGDGELFRKLKNTRAQPAYLKRMKRAPWPWQAILAIKEIFDLLKKEKPDVLFLCSTTAGLLGSIAGSLYKLKIIYRIGGWAFRDPRAFWKNWLIFWAEKITARFKDLIIVNSEYDWRIAVEKKIISPEKIIKIYNGLDPNSLDFLSREEARRRLTPGVDKKTPGVAFVGCVANFYKTKGLAYLIQAFHYLEPGSQYLIIIGDGKLRPQLEAQIKKLGLEDRVILTGRIPDAYKYLKAFDLSVLPSLKEGFPWVILEAAAAGIPIVATRVGAIPEILPEECLVEPGDSQELAKKISRMLEQPAKPKLKQDFSLRKMAEETEKLF